MPSPDDTPDSLDDWFDAARARVPAFCARHFGLRGTLRLHRAALGWDILRAPLNVMLAPVYLLSRIAALVLRLCGLRAAAGWLADHPPLLRTAVAARIEHLVLSELLQIGRQTARPLDRPLGDYTGTRNAMAEITTQLGTLGTGAILFKTVTPGVVSLAPALALTWAQAAAIAAFPLGGGLGAAWYGWFPAEAPLSLTIEVGVALSLAASLLTTFAGLVADPVQLVLGIHRRRLLRVIDTLERTARGEAATFRAHEHLLARAGDIADLGVTLLRLFRP